jgi:hypothetical protein
MSQHAVTDITFSLTQDGLGDRIQDGQQAISIGQGPRRLLGTDVEG